MCNLGTVAFRTGAPPAVSGHRQRVLASSAPPHPVVSLLCVAASMSRPHQLAGTANASTSIAVSDDGEHPTHAVEAPLPSVACPQRHPRLPLFGRSPRRSRRSLLLWQACGFAVMLAACGMWAALSATAPVPQPRLRAQAGGRGLVVAMHTSAPRRRLLGEGNATYVAPRNHVQLVKFEVLIPLTLSRLLLVLPLCPTAAAR